MSNRGDAEGLVDALKRFGMIDMRCGLKCCDGIYWAIKNSNDAAAMSIRFKNAGVCEALIQVWQCWEFDGILSSIANSVIALLVNSHPECSLQFACTIVHALLESHLRRGVESGNKLTILQACSTIGRLVSRESDAHSLKFASKTMFTLLANVLKTWEHDVEVCKEACFACTAISNTTVLDDLFCPIFSPLARVFEKFGPVNLSLCVYVCMVITRALPETEKNTVVVDDCRILSDTLGSLGFCEHVVRSLNSWKIDDEEKDDKLRIEAKCVARYEACVAISRLASASSENHARFGVTDLHEILSIMLGNNDYLTIASACDVIYRLTRDDAFTQRHKPKFISTTVHSQLVKVLETHEGSCGICEMATLAILSVCWRDFANTEKFTHQDMLFKPLICGLARYGNVSRAVAGNVCSIISWIVQNNADARFVIGALDVETHIVRMFRFWADAEFCTFACSALESLAVHEFNNMNLLFAQAHKPLVRALQSFGRRDANVCFAVCAAISAFIFDQNHRHLFASTPVLLDLIGVLDEFGLEDKALRHEVCDIIGRIMMCDRELPFDFTSVSIALVRLLHKCGRNRDIKEIVCFAFVKLGEISKDTNLLSDFLITTDTLRFIKQKPACGIHAKVLIDKSTRG